MFLWKYSRKNSLRSNDAFSLPLHRLSGALGGKLSGLAFTEDELEIKGDITTHTYYGGSGLSLHLNFCSHCSTKIYSKPDILDGMVYVPAGLLHDQIDFMPKVEIWAKSKPKWMVAPDSILQAYEENGTIERITSILENLDQRG